MNNSVLLTASLTTTVQHWRPSLSSPPRPWAYYLKRRKWGTEITLVYEDGERKSLADIHRPSNFAEARAAVAALGVELAELE